eukprot:4459241-Amphidinium_carterae.2
MSAGLAAMVTEVTLDPWSLVKPHTGVRITLSSQHLQTLVPVWCKPAQLAEERVPGPALPCRKHVWLWREGAMPNNLSAVWMEWLGEVSAWMLQWQPKPGFQSEQGELVRWKPLHQAMHVQRASLYDSR